VLRLFVYLVSFQCDKNNVLAEGYDNWRYLAFPSDLSMGIKIYVWGALPMGLNKNVK